MATVVETPASNLNQVVRAIFYLVTPNETSFRHIEEVPNYVDKVRETQGAWKVFVFFVIKLTLTL